MITPSNITKRHRVLVGVPHGDKKNYCIEDCIARLKSFTYPYYDVLIVDNSQSRKNYKLFLKEGFKVIHIKPKNHSIQKILADSHEAIRQYAIRNKYHYLLHYESDIISPPDVIQRLMIHDKPIVSATYMIDFGSESHMMSQRIEHFGDIRETINVKDGSDLLSVNGHLISTFACGLGCCLINAKVLPEFTFRYEKGLILHPDSLFALDTDALGIPKYIDSSLLCIHENSSWTSLM